MERLARKVLPLQAADLQPPRRSMALRRRQATFLVTACSAGLEALRAKPTHISPSFDISAI
jgi:hypothetical protein